MIHHQSGIGKFVPLLAFVFVFQISRGMTLPIFPLYFRTIDLSAIGIGLVLGVYGFSFLFFEALWGFLFDKFQSRQLMLIIVMGNSIAILAFSRPSSFAELIILELLLGMGLGGVGVFPRIAIAKVAGNLERGRIFGILGALYSIGATLGSLLGGAVDSTLGLSISFVTAAIISIISLLPYYWHASFFGKLESAVLSTSSSTSDPIISPRDKIPRSRAGFIGILSIGLIGLAMAANNGFYNLLFPNILKQSSQISANVVEISIVLAIFTLSNGIVSPFTSSLGWRKPGKWITGGLLLTGALYAVLSQLQNVLRIDLATIAIGVSTSFITPLSLSLLTERVPRKILGRTMGIYGAVEDVGLILGSSAAGIIWGLWGAEYAFFLIALIFFAVATIFLLVRRSESREAT
jgi:MFS family permease